MDTIHKQEFRVRDLSTRTVTLFPERAQVVRDIKDVSLKPGINQITVVGFSPTVDENSIKVEGTGSAIISDISVELLPNREIFQEIYPSDDSDDEDEDNDDDDSMEDENDSDYDCDDNGLMQIRAQLKKVRGLLANLRDEKAAGLELVRSAASRLGILDAHSKAILDPRWGSHVDSEKIDNTDGSSHSGGHGGHGPAIDQALATYREERAVVFTDHQAGVVAQRQLAAKIADQEKVEKRLVRDRHRAVDKAKKVRLQAKRAREREVAAVNRRRAAARMERKRVRREREATWPRLCYTVRITLDAPSGRFLTPASSRRGSVTSLTELEAASDKASAAEGGTGDGEDTTTTCDLAISYVTAGARWSPTYDLQLSTTTATGLLCFDALLHNLTSETWASCKIVLSTSQTTIAGLHDTVVPALVPWRVKLAHGGSGQDGLLTSREERDQISGWRSKQSGTAAQKVPRSELFGVGLSPPPLLRPMACLKQAPSFQPPQAQQQLIHQMAIPAPRPRARIGNAFAAPPPFPVATSTATGFGSYSPGSNDDEGESENDVAVDGQTMVPGGPGALSFQESSFEETGLTATYDLPGLKTLAPTAPATEYNKQTASSSESSYASKQRVARVRFQGVQFSHTVVAKYKPAAFLRAKLRNGSRLTLLRGPAGLTLDGAFLGRTTLPRCGPDGDTVTLSLGVDPTLRVAYPAPAVRRSTTGLFTKEASNVYTRSILITNTATAAAAAAAAAATTNLAPCAKLLVYDQIPVSEDEKLRVDVQQPHGLTVDGVAVATGVGSLAGSISLNATAAGPASSSTATVRDWGKATATLRKNGEVVWEVTLQPGRAVRLDLAYDVILPTGEGVVQC